MLRVEKGCLSLLPPLLSPPLPGRHLTSQGYPGLSSHLVQIPSANDIPIDFRVRLFEDAPNRRTIYSSKGVGEPPLNLAISVPLAIRDAIASARKDNGLTGPFRIDTPLTVEVIPSHSPFFRSLPVPASWLAPCSCSFVVALILVLRFCLLTPLPARRASAAAAALPCARAGTHQLCRMRF